MNDSLIITLDGNPDKADDETIYVILKNGKLYDGAIWDAIISLDETIETLNYLKSKRPEHNWTHEPYDQNKHVF